MTIDLKKYVADKQQEKDGEIYTQIGELLNGLPLNSTLNILAALAASAVRHMPREEKGKNAFIFSQIMMSSNEEIIQ